MSGVLVVVVVLLACGGAVAVAVSGWSDLVGTASRRRRRREEILRSFDGRPEVRVRTTGAGMTAEETALLGHRHGYAVVQWETGRGTPPRLVMRRATGPAPAPGFGPPPPERPLSKAPDPGARKRQIGTLVALGIGTGSAAVSEVRAGASAVVPAICALAFLGGAVALALVTRSAGRRAAAPLPGVPGGPLPGPPAPPPSGGPVETQLPPYGRTDAQLPPHGPPVPQVPPHGPQVAPYGPIPDGSSPGGRPGR
ncbi:MULTISPECIES: hypothetical protein [Streptomyces]|uniref:Uncharacterized protein n=1 Tax=Streptomyces ramulosus TaxID=47762 RepID=A0ABW1FM30_9ACTN